MRFSKYSSLSGSRYLKPHRFKCTRAQNITKEPFRVCQLLSVVSADFFSSNKMLLPPSPMGEGQGVKLRVLAALWFPLKNLLPDPENMCIFIVWTGE